MNRTSIEWTDATWNPIRGCSRVSEGCRHCYAESVAYRFSGEGQPYEGLVRIGADGERRPEWNGTIKFVEEHLLDPLRWKTPRRIFVNSMSDLFHEGVTDEMLDRIFAVMALCPQHTFQVLTKRPARMRAYLSASRTREDVTVAGECTFDECELPDARMPYAADNLLQWPLPNVWLGVSVENQAAADRLDVLCEIAADGWQTMVSFEPLLSYVSAGARWLSLGKRTWAIVGGESGVGPGIRPMHPDWARSLRDQCVAAGVPFFFKQWGEWTPGENVDRTSGVVSTATWFDGRWSFGKENLANDEGHRDDEPDVYRVGKKAAGDLLDGVRWHQFPEVPRG